jgi:hypothetical protein
MLVDRGDEAQQTWVAGAEQFVRTQMLPSERVPAGHPARAWDPDVVARVERDGDLAVRAARRAANRTFAAAKKASDRETMARISRWRAAMSETMAVSAGTASSAQWLAAARIITTAQDAWLADEDLGDVAIEALGYLTALAADRAEAMAKAAAEALAEAIEAEVKRRNEPGAWKEELQRRDDAANGLAGDDGQDDEDDPADTYYVQRGCLYWRKPTRDDIVPTQLATFNAEITEEIKRDDDTETTYLWRVKVTAADNRSGEVQIPPALLSQPQKWATDAVGNSAIVMPGFGAADHLRAAVQLRSRSITRRTVYTHTGWRLLDQGWSYLSATGALGKDGMDTSVSVDLGPLSGFALPEVPKIPGICDTPRISLGLLGLATDRVMVPLLAAVYRAALPLPPVCTTWLYGRSGTLKTAITAVKQQHYGRTLGPQNLPGNWTSTANALESQAYTLKNAVFTVDDYSPDSTEADAKRRAAAADRLMRGSANGSGRGRLNSDGTQRPEKPPRALVVTSAEDVPPNIPSLLARTFIVEISPGDINLKALTDAQAAADAGDLDTAMAGYVRWLAARYDADPDFVASLAQQQNDLREKAQEGGRHLRVAGNIAAHALGWRMFLAFACETGAITEGEQNSYWKRGLDALITVGADQERYRQAADPVTVYLGAVRSLVAAGKAYLVGRNGNAPAQATSWGWKHFSIGETGGELRPTTPGAVCLGWIDGEDIYLHPANTYAAARKFATDAGHAFTVGKNTVHKDLHERQLLASKDKDHYTKKVTNPAPNQGRNFIHITVATLDKASDAAEGSSATEDGDG